MNHSQTMKAAVISEWGGPEVIKICDVDKPTPQHGEALIRVRAFGVNHADSYFRRGLWGDVAKISGIECVGEIESDPQGYFQPGQVVVAVVGGLGRNRNGSYAEYTVAATSNVLAVNRKSLGWAELAALPEVYTTAWWCLTKNIRLSKDQTLLVRGGTSALGQAAINIARSIGSRIIATTSKESSISILKNLGVEEAVTESAFSCAVLREWYPRGVDAVFDLIGASALKDSLKMVGPYGHVCMAGFLGGLAPIDQFNPLTDLPSGVSLSFFGSAFVLGTADFPLSQTPMQSFVDQTLNGAFKSKPARVFQFEQIVEAHQLMESGNAGGKIVVLVP